MPERIKCYLVICEPKLNANPFEANRDAEEFLPVVVKVSSLSQMILVNRKGRPAHMKGALFLIATSFDGCRKTFHSLHCVGFIRNLVGLIPPLAPPLLGLGVSK